MANRKRANTSLPCFEERHSTKKEREMEPQRPICPPLIRKINRAFAKNRLKIQQTFFGTAKPLHYLRGSHFSKFYDIKKKMSYIMQVFDVCGKIGEGSFGNVYQARSLEDGRYYAIKISKNAYTGHTESRREVACLERIGDHPHCVKYVSAWEEKQHVFIQFELCATSLDKYAKANHNISEQQLWDVLLDMLLALKHLHDKKFIHLDIKPDNIMISEDGTNKLADFGILVDLLESQENQNLNNSKISEGDAKYLAREVLEGTYTTAADIFSLGITMLELATDLVLPINGPLWHQLRNGHFPDKYLANVPVPLLKIIKKMMRQNFKIRPSAEQLLKQQVLKRKLNERNKGLRINYFKQWKESNTFEEPTEPLEQWSEEKFIEDASPLQFSMSVDLRNNNNSGARNPFQDRSPVRMDAETLHVDTPDSSSSPCTTPPCGISKVILYTV